MNKSDLKLVIVIVVIIIIFILITKVFESKDNKKALVYYENKLVQTIDLSLPEINEYQVDGYNGKVVIETKKDSIRVKEEISPLHICSRQGWISSPYQVIVCLPNKIVIKIESNNNEIDTVVR